MKNATLGDWGYIGMAVALIILMIYLYWYQYHGKGAQREISEK